MRAVCRPRRACFLNSWSKVAAETTAKSRPPKHLLSYHSELFICWSRWMYVSVFFCCPSRVHLKVCAFVCVLVFLENKTLQSTTTKWSAGLWIPCVLQMNLDGKDTQPNASCTYSNSGQQYFWHGGCWTQLKCISYFSSNTITKWHISLEWFRQSKKKWYHNNFTNAISGFILPNDHLSPACNGYETVSRVIHFKLC